MWNEVIDSTKYILCGRGKCSYNCEGNKVFRRSIERHLNSYMNFETRAKKSDLILRVTEELRSLGMIFMMITDGGIMLKELSPSEARKKVALRFRDAARTAKQVEEIHTASKCLRTKPTVFRLEANQVTRSQTIDSPCLQHQKIKKPLLISDSLKKDERGKSTQSSVSSMYLSTFCTNGEFLAIRKHKV